MSRLPPPFDTNTIDQVVYSEIPEALQAEERVEQEDFAYSTCSAKPSADLLHDLTSCLEINRSCMECRVPDCPIESLCYCFGCKTTFHKKCWASDRRHIPQQGFQVCEPPTDLATHVWIRWILEPKTPLDEQIDLLAADFCSKWFGVVENPPRVPSLLVWPRLSQLILKYQHTTASGIRARQYPSLVSFFGDTGGGKSTLIKTLIRSCNPSTLWEAPVPGITETSNYSTSGDVNLYIEPSSARGETPMFFADCEGLRGSSITISNAPAGVKFFDSPGPKNLPSSHHRSPPFRESPEERMRSALEDHREKSIHEFKLLWAVKQKVSQEDPSSRKYIVKRLFPKFLYIFSDVVCYVTENARSTEQEISDLMEWASLGYRQTINQRIKPSLIVIINRDARSGANKWWDIEYATRTQINKLNKSFKSFSSLVDKWTERGKSIKSTEELISCYYDSFKVVCIPSLFAVPTRIIAGQYEKLQSEVHRASMTIRAKRKAAGIRMDIESFSFLTQNAFESFSKNLEDTFDLQHMTERAVTVPKDFADRLVELLAKLMNKRAASMESLIGQEVAMLGSFIPYLASSLALEYAERREGNLEDYLKAYTPKWQKALNCFYKKHWRCEAFNRTLRHRCLNFYNGHSKGHQFSPDQSLQVGDFVGRFDLNATLEYLTSEIRNALHYGALKDRLIDTAQRSGVFETRSNRNCLTCLLRRPLHLLPCKHCLCDQCALRFNVNDIKGEEHILKIPSCPLGCKYGPDPWRIRLKPASAGVRVLSLDGGGVRGILELCVLKRVEDVVGIPIYELFDIAIGTSTGGIIALGLFKKQWGIDRAIREFEQLTRKAFDPRYGSHVALLRHATQLLYSYQYKSSGIESALKEAFEEDQPLFGHMNMLPERVKVGVITLNNEEGRPYLLANYSRDWLSIANDVNTYLGGINLSARDDLLRREEDPEDEMMIWEAARCTSAAQTYFESYYHRRTRQHYSDGALGFNNPISIADCERRFIWPKNSPDYPDIILSVGTGILAGLDSDSLSYNNMERLGNKLIQQLMPRGLAGRLGLAIQTIRSTLDCESKWKEFANTIRHDKELSERYHRVNVALSCKPPKIDEFSKLADLKAEAETYLSLPSVSEHIETIARRLTASLFYFVPHTRKHQEDNPNNHLLKPKGFPYIWSGRLCCRLNHILDKQFLALIRRKPVFRVVHGDGKTTPPTPLLHPTPRVNFDMKTFESEVEVEVVDKRRRATIEIAFQDEREWNAISGFPCIFEDLVDPRSLGD